MKSSTKQLNFIRLKAEGRSNAQIARALHISESTASRYTHLLEDQIAQYKADQLRELYDAFHMTREARIRQLGGILARIDDALEQAELSMLLPEKLLDMRLKYTASLKDEYIPLYKSKQADQMNTAAEILQEMAKLLARVQGGDIDRDQAALEMKVLESILKGMELVELEERLRELEITVAENKGRV